MKTFTDHCRFQGITEGSPEEKVAHDAWSCALRIGRGLLLTSPDLDKAHSALVGLQMDDERLFGVRRKRNSEETGNEVVGLRMPTELVVQAKDSMRGRFSSFSEYMRDLVRKDVDRREKESEDKEGAA